MYLKLYLKGHLIVDLLLNLIVQHKVHLILHNNAPQIILDSPSYSELVTESNNSPKVYLILNQRVHLQLYSIIISENDSAPQRGLDSAPKIVLDSVFLCEPYSAPEITHQNLT